MEDGMPSEKTKRREYYCTQPAHLLIHYYTYTRQVASGEKQRRVGGTIIINLLTAVLHMVPWKTPINKSDHD